MSNFNDKYLDLYDLERFRHIQGKFICRAIIFTQGNPTLDTPINVHIAVKSLPNDNHLALKNEVDKNL